MRALQFLIMFVATSFACGDDAECRSQCELGAATCEEKPFASFGDLEAGRAEYRQRCNDGVLWAFEATCKQGTSVLRSGTGYTSEGRFYAASSGAFLGLTTTTDTSTPPCNGKSFWPTEVPCEAPVVTQIMCGTGFRVGDSGGAGITN